jgi:predicted CoA-binding protein
MFHIKMNEMVTSQKSERELIDEFLALKRIAFIGVSSNKKHFSRSLYTGFRDKGFDVVPVHPNLDTIDEQAVFSKVQDIDSPVDGAFIVTSADVTLQIVKDCKEANISKIWMHRGAGKGSVNQAAVELCHENSIEVIPGQCPFMFFPGTPFFHKIHGFFKKITGSYPK